MTGRYAGDGPGPSGGFDPSRRRHPTDRGSASLWVLGFAIVVWVAAASVVVGAGAVAARHRAAAAADLAALAAASVLADSAVGITVPVATTSAQADSRSAACGAAASVTSANGARLVRCDIEGQRVVVEAAVALTAIARFVAPGNAADAVARAGSG